MCVYICVCVMHVYVSIYIYIYIYIEREREREVSACEYNIYLCIWSICLFFHPYMSVCINTYICVCMLCVCLYTHFHTHICHTVINVWIYIVFKKKIIFHKNLFINISSIIINNLLSIIHIFIILHYFYWLQTTQVIVQLNRGPIHRPSLKLKSAFLDHSNYLQEFLLFKESILSYLANILCCFCSIVLFCFFSLWEKHVSCIVFFKKTHDSYNFSWTLLYLYNFII